MDNTVKDGATEATKESPSPRMLPRWLYEVNLMIVVYLLMQSFVERIQSELPSNLSFYS
jgi:hypothetical protein